MLSEMAEAGPYLETTTNSCLHCNETEGGENETEKVTLYMSSLGVWLAVPEWEAALTAVTLSLIIVLTLVGNVLVILSVFTYRPLRSAPNFFIVSLAVADMTVALLVLPLNVAYSILGRWVLGKIICELWATCDVLCCTSSILHLCAIAVDRYRAITDPVNYARKRTLQRVLSTIAVVWIMSFLISSPPMLGWNDWPKEFTEDTACALSSQQGYIIFSSLGSFFIPLVVMTAVYIRIFIATRRRLRQRARASRLSAMARQRSIESCGGGGKPKNEEHPERERSSISSIENNGNDGSGDHCLQKSLENENSAAMEKKLPRKESSRRVKNLTDSTRRREGTGEGGIRSLRTTDHLQDQLTTNEFEASKLSPANLSEDSVTDAEVPLNQVQKLPPTNHASLRDSYTKNPGGSRNKRSNRQPSQQVCQFVEEKQRISLSKERKAARTLGIIMGVFVVCWLPFFLMYVIMPFCTDCPQPSSKLANFITWLGYVNSSLNPLIYTVFNLDFRKAFKKLLHLDK